MYKAFLVAHLVGLLRVSSAGLADDTSLVQGSLQAHRASSSALDLPGRLSLLQKIGSNEVSSAAAGNFDCDAAPDFCKPPFNCHKWDPSEHNVLQEGIAPNGEINYGLWCTGVQYYPYIRECVVTKDLVKAAQVQFEWSVNDQHGLDEMDGSYCFIDGHCSNAAVTNETTVEEAVQMCDERFTRKGWSELGKLSELPGMLYNLRGIGRDIQARNGYHDARYTVPFLKAACAMGNYHCDVVYCKETYCKNPYYVKKYSHLLPKAPGHLLQSREHLD